MLRWIFPFSVFCRQRDRISELELENEALRRANKRLRDESIADSIRAINTATLYASTLTSMISSMDGEMAEREKYTRASYEHQKRMAEQLSNSSPQRVPHELPRRDAGS